MNSCCSASTLVKAVCWVDSLEVGEVKYSLKWLKKENNCHLSLSPK